MMTAVLLLLALLAITVPGGYFFVRKVLHVPAVNGAFDTGSIFFTGLLLNIAVLNGLQWFPGGFAAKNAFWVLVVLHAAAFLWALAKKTSRVREMVLSGVNAIGEKSKGDSWRLAKWSFGLALVFITLWCTHVVLQLPIIGWDAWSGWVAKAKVWQAEGLHTAIVPASDWLTGAAAAGQYSSHMWHYPDAVGLLYAVLAQLAPEGSLERGAAVLWPLGSAMLALGMFGYFRFYWKNTFRHSGWIAMLPGLLLLLTPLWLQHTLFPGYADLLLACFVWYAAIYYVLWLSDESPGFRYASFLFLAVLPLIKLIGWLLVGLFFMTHMINRPRYRRLLLVMTALTVIAGIIVWLLMPLEVTTPYGQAKLSREYLALPGYGQVQIGWFFSGQAWLDGMLFSRNWLLLWLGAPFALWLGLRRVGQSAAEVFLFTLTFGFLLVLFVVYNLTSFSQFATMFTSSNRLLLHIYPVYLTCLFSLAIPQKRVVLQQDP